MIRQIRRQRSEIRKTPWLIGLSVLCSLIFALSVKGAWAAGHPKNGERVQIRGVLEVVIADDFIHRRSETSYTLRTEKGETYLLRFSRPAPSWPSGTSVFIEGTKIEDRLAVKKIEKAVPQKEKP